MTTTLPEPVTLTYKTIENTPIFLDLYPPSIQLSDIATEKKHIPAVLYFHGGGLTVGNRKSWFPVWLHNRLASSGIALISFDYRLLPHTDGHAILEDIQDAFRFVSTEINARIDELIPVTCPHIDPDALGVAGSSAGGYCAYLAAAHVIPRPKMLLTVYAMGGNFLTHQYLIPKTKPFFRGREILSSEGFKEYFYPFSPDLQGSVTAESLPSYHSLSSGKPGYPSNPRMLLARLYLQLGVCLDYITGEHSPSVSERLRQAMLSYSTINHDTAENILREVLPVRAQSLFPQLLLNSTWPPTFLIHGTEDTAVLASESRAMHAALQKRGVRTELREIEGEEHAFDISFGSAQFAPVFDEAVEFIKAWLDTPAFHNIQD